MAQNCKTFICECGKAFNNSQSFNGHKSNCKIHYAKKYGSLAEYEAMVLAHTEKIVKAGKIRITKKEWKK